MCTTFKGNFSGQKKSEDFNASYFVVIDAAHCDVRSETGSQWYPEECVAHVSMLIKHMLLKLCRLGEQIETRSRIHLYCLHHINQINNPQSPSQSLMKFQTLTQRLQHSTHQ